MSQKRLIVDMDGTLARFHDEVDYLERMFEEGFFVNLKPFENMVEGIKSFIKQHPQVPVLVCSAAIDSPFVTAEKNQWVDKYLPEVPVANRIYTEMGKSKADYLPGGVSKDDYLLDDYNRGLHRFMHDGGSAIKCHNNINQKGMGTHGGNRGLMWEGPMVHADDSPELIAAELADLMGIERRLERAAQDNEIIYETTQSKHISGPLPVGKAGKKHLFEMENSLRGHHFVARQRNQGDFNGISYFKNPYNAMRYMSGDKEAKEFELRTFDGEELSVSGYQLQAICQNTYGSTDYQRFLKADRVQLADDVQAAMKHWGEAVVGYVREFDRDGLESNCTACHSHKEMLDLIQSLEDHGQAYKEEWFVPLPVQKEKEIIQQKQAVDSFDRVLQSAQQRANNMKSPVSPGREPEPR